MGKAMALPRSPHHSVDEYLARERASLTRHEYLDGQIYDMAGESLQHSRICINLAREVSSQLKGRECEALSPNMKVKTADSGLFSYPDLTVVCGEPIFLDSHRDVLLNPVVIFEVLSPSTEAYDRGEKFFRYGNFIDTLADYLLVSRHRPVVERFVRQPDAGQWLYSAVEGLSNHVDIRSIGRRIDLAEILLKSRFFAAPGPGPKEP
jgi:Uma2 family endonuclease